MARSLKPSAPETASYHGEIWTDARGYATVRLPAGASRLLPPLEYELCDVDAHSSVRLSGELKDGRFAMETDEPHVKVAWRISGRAAGAEQEQTASKEDQQ
jgi:hypothetical protein